MSTNSPPAWLTITTSAFAIGASSAGVAIAQDGVDEPVEEIIVVGTRRTSRTAADTPLPVDVFDEEDLSSVASADLTDAIQTLVPSFNVLQYDFDGAQIIRSPRMRGLDSDKVLILVNGKRRHRAALVALVGSGSHGPDLATIPNIALRGVEVLRDGASAMYGSDAIAGVMNFNLKDSAEGGELQAQVGQFTLGDEESYLVAGNIGLPLGNNGFVNISAEWSDTQGTSRGVEFNLPIGSSGLTPAESALVSGFFDHDGDPNTPDQERFGPDALTEIFVGGQVVSIFNSSDGIPDDTDTRYADNLRHAEISDNELVQLWGQPERDAFNVIVNTGYDLSGTASLYGWFNFSDNNVDGNFFHRRPGIPALGPLRTPDGTIYNPRDLFPAGYTPRFFGNVLDRGFTGGLRGEWNNGLTYDFGGRFGRSEVRYKSINTMNPSLGPATPTEFKIGNLISDESALTADFTLPVELGFAVNTTIAFGAEFRSEGYVIEAGEPASYEVGAYAAPDPWDFETSVDEAANGENGGVVECRIPGLESVGTPCPAGDPIHNGVPVGADGFPGYPPVFSSDYERDSWAVYGDIESDITDQFLLTLAARYEDFSDFGDNLSARIGARYRFGDRIALRGSYGTGFRAPTPGQISTTNVRTRVGQDSTPVAVGIFPATHPASQVFGAEPLDAETSTQWTFGLTSTPTDNLTFTLDYYHIKLDDRLFISSTFTVGPAERLVLETSGVPGAGSIAQVTFFNNDIDTETDGLDFVGTWAIDWAGGMTTLTASANWNSTEVTRRTPRPDGFFMSDQDVFDTENGPPKYRALLGLNHTWANDLSLSVRGNWYGGYTNENGFNPGQFQEFGDLVQVDMMLNWNFYDGRYAITVGGTNIFDEQPAPAEFEICCGGIVRFDTVMDWQGPFYYVRGSFRWN